MSSRLTGAAVAAAVGACLLACGSVAAESKPNVLFIAVDDLRPEFGAYGGRAITPHLDRLAATGTRFDRVYCQQAVCGASRVSVLCGLYPTFTGEQTFHVEGWRERLPDVVTMNQHFRDHGYRTLGIGKIYHGAHGPGVDPENWDEWLTLESPVRLYATESNRELHRLGAARLRATGVRENTRGPLTEAAAVSDDAYTDGRVAERAVEVIEGIAAEPDRPFFFAVGLVKPHLPFTAPERYWDLYRREDFAMPTNRAIPPGYPRAAAKLIPGEMRPYADYEGRGPRDFSDELNQRLLHGYVAAASYIDACLGRVLDALESSGLADNTIVVLWGDHGWKLGDHGSWCKHTNFECDTRVPLLVRDPRVDRVAVSEAPVELIDLFPTICDLAGLPTPGPCQGESFARLLSTADARSREDAYSSYPASGRERATGHSLRWGDYRYTEWRSDATGAVTARVLTDLSADPGEVTNVVDDPHHADALAIVERRLESRIQDALTPRDADFEGYRR